MLEIDYETKRIHTVNPFFACVFLRRLSPVSISNRKDSHPEVELAIADNDH